MKDVVKFDDLTNEELLDEVKEIPVDLVAVDNKAKKSFVLKLDNFGLITIGFREGGHIPPACQGQYTSIEDAKVAIRQWQKQTGKVPNVIEEINRKESVVGVQ